MRAALVSLFLVSAVLGAETEDQRFLDGLRARRLFRLAETYCQQRLADPRLSEEVRAQLAVELIRCFAQHATYLTPAERDEYWKRARDTAAGFVARNAGNPRLYLVRVQDALTLLAHGELSRQEAEVGVRPAESLELALGTIREAARLLDQLDRELGEAIPRSRTRSSRPGELTADELLTLQCNVRYQLARAFRNRALCYPDASEDRIAALTQAIEQLNRSRTQLAPGDPLAWQIQIDQAVCYRSLSDLEQARQVLTAVPLDNVSPETLLLLRAEAVRLELAAGRPASAMQLLATGREVNGVVSPELDLAQLETFAAMWQAAIAAGESAGITQWEQKSLAMLKFLDQTHGKYWGRRGDLVLLESGAARPADGSLELLARTADNLFLKGDLDEAIAAYQKAAENALSARRPDESFALRYKAGLIDQQRGRLADAAQRFRTLALSHPDDPRAGQAHLLAAWLVAQLASKDPQAVETYREVLAEHLTAWPEAESADRARLWLARLRQSERSWPEAISAYEGVSAGSADFVEAVRGSGECWLARLSELERAGEPHGKQAQAATDFFESVILGAQQRLPERWSDAARAALPVLAQIQLRYGTRPPAATQQLIEAALNGSPDADDRWTSSVRMMLVAALAAQPQQVAQAEKLLEQMSDESAERWLELLRMLHVRVEQDNSQTRARLAQLELRAIGRLASLPTRLATHDQKEVACIRAAALAATARQDQALRAYEQLVRDFPDDASIQQGYAQLLLDADDEGSLRQSLERWRLIAKRSRPNSELWFRAWYSMSLAYFKLGDKQEAAQRIRFLQATADFSTTQWKQPLADLLEKCQP